MTTNCRRGKQGDTEKKEGISDDLSGDADPSAPHEDRLYELNELNEPSELSDKLDLPADISADAITGDQSAEFSDDGLDDQPAYTRQGCAPSRISQLHNSALKKIRTYFEQNGIHDMYFS